jgi:hypothetical protein
MGFPMWSTPQRQAFLVQHFLQSGGQFLLELGDSLVDPYAEMVIDLWKSEDREEREASWKREKRRLHALPEILKRGPFDSIAREEYLAGRPLFSIEALGVGAFTFRRVAKVVLPALEKKVLWVSLAGVDEGLSKNAKRKLIRYKKGKLPRELEETVFARCAKAVKQYLDS